MILIPHENRQPNKNKNKTNTKVDTLACHRRKLPYSADTFWCAVRSIPYCVCLQTNRCYISSSPLSRIQRGGAALDRQQGRGLPRSHGTRLKAAWGQQVPLRGRKRPRKCLRALSMFVLRVRGQNENRRHAQERTRCGQVREGAVAPRHRRRQFTRRRTPLGALKLSRTVDVDHRPPVQGNVSEKQQSRLSLPRVFAFSRMRFFGHTSARRTARSSRHSPLSSPEPAPAPSRSTRGARKTRPRPPRAHWWSRANYGN